MKKVSLLTSERTIRTQITLTEGLKKEIEERASRKGQSMAAYLRQAAIRQIAEEKKKEKERRGAAGNLIGAMRLEDHPEWATTDMVYDWVREERKAWEK